MANKIQLAILEATVGVVVDFVVDVNVVIAVLIVVSVHK